MIKNTKFKNAKLRYSDSGTGTPIVLLHGYLESLEIYNNLEAELSKTNRVICIDIPGHGESGIVAAYHTMETMAEAVLEVLNELNIDKCYLVGHSMGGYVTMAFVSNFPERLNGFCLLHSTPFADSEEKKQNRDREIELIRNGKKELIVNTNIPRAFANDNLKTFSKEVDYAQSIARISPDEGVITLLNGMKERTDKTSVLQKTSLPCLWILGKKDNYIVYDVIKEKLSPLNEKGKTLILENSGHMGFVEEQGKVVEALKEFCQ